MGVVLVTGASRSLGAAMARALGAAGWSVAVNYAHDDAGAGAVVDDIVSAGGKAAAFKFDVTDKASVRHGIREIEAKLGALDVIVNNAWGGGTIKRLENKSDDEMMHGVRLGYMAVFFLMQAAYPHLKKQGGSIVTLCSLNGVNAHLYTAEYNGAKEAARALTRTAAREWARHGIRANVICPAAATEAYEAFRQMAPDNAAALLKQNPMGRMGDPEDDIGSVALFLASDDSRYLTGNTLFADGGSHMNGVQWDPELPED